jgi:hypothetical protein
VGAAIAFKVANPTLSIPIALASHFVLDKIPHWNPHSYTETVKNGKPDKQSTLIALVDVVVSLGLGIFIASQALPSIKHAIVILIACFASVLPDVVKIPFYYFNKRGRILEKWIDFERALQVEISFLPGVLTQLLIIFTSIWWVLT